MGDTGEATIFESGEFEVVDECVDEEDSTVSKNSSKPLPAKSNDEPENNTHTLSETTSENKVAVMENAKPLDEMNKDDDSGATAKTNTEAVKTIPEEHVQRKQQFIRPQRQIDFTADISMEQLDAPGEYMTDEEIMNHLDEIENIVLDGTSFELQDDADQSNSNLNFNTPETDVQKKKAADEHPRKLEIKPNEDVKKTSEESKDAKQSPSEVEIKKDEEKSALLDTETKTAETDWYEEKIQVKVATVKDRLSKLARVLELSYPRYKGWLDRNEATTGISICRLDEPRRCPLEKPHTNRWKFVCNRKPVQESTEKQITNEAQISGNSDSTMWRLTPTGVWDSNTDNSTEYPPFVMKAVKVFEDFLQKTPSTDESSPQPRGEVTFRSGSTPKSEESSTRNDTDEKESAKQQWLWLLVRCNRMDELMLFATGRNIDRTTMDNLKQVYEEGPGKDCKVKSLYCKSIIKTGNTTSNTTTFLVGSEALDEIVGGIKIQLAPKTNFWSNAAGAESLGNAVADLLSPTPKTTVVEIGCGTGLIGLMLASKCHQVIGLDSPSEVEEAEMTSELNGIKNASFVMGEPTAVMGTITKVLSNCKAMAIVNTNTNIGRAIEVMTDLRKIISLKRLVMVTTLTKQSVRSILELTRPGDQTLGNPFMPLRACVVDTLPIGPHFEVVILMERRIMNKFPRRWNALNSTTSAQTIPVGNKGAATPGIGTAGVVPKKEKLGPNRGPKTIEPTSRRNIAKPEPVSKKAKLTLGGPGKKAQHFASKQFKNVPQPPQPKNKFRAKRFHSPERTHVPAKKFANKFDKGNFKPWVAQRVSPEHRLHDDKKGPNKFDNCPRKNFPYKNRGPIVMKDEERHKPRSWSTESSMRRDSPNRDKTFRDNKEQSDLRERLSGNRIEPEIMEKFKKQQQMLDMAKQKLPSASVDVATAKQLQNMLNMVLEQTNKLQSQLPRSVWDRIAPPETIPSSSGIQPQIDPLLKGRYVQEMGTQDILITTANREFLNPNEQLLRLNYDRFNDLPPQSRNSLMSSGLRHESSGDRFQNSMPDRYHSRNIDYHKQQEEQESQWNREKELDQNRWESFQRVKKNSSPIGKQISPLRHHLSTTTTGRPVSPRRGLSPTRRQVSPQRRHVSPLRRQISPPRRQMSPPRHVLSPSRRHLSPSRRQLSPSRRIDDEWDIPSRGAVEQNTWQRAGERMPEKRWHEERQPPTLSGWDNPGNNERYRKSVNQDKWDIKDASHDAVWVNTGSGDTWEPKQPPVMPNKEHWQSVPDNRWQNSTSGSNGDKWNIRGKESFAKPSTREENKSVWTEQPNKLRWGDSLASIKDSWGLTEKEDWNDLPDDAKDPWGDDGNNVSKDRWSKYENNAGPSSGWSRENQPGDTWSKPGDNWQSKSVGGNKPQWQSSTGGQVMNETRWVSNDGAKKGVSMSSGWQGNQNTNNSWPSQNYPGFQQSRSYNSGSFKDRR